jgi:hypothetical protein
MSLRLEPLEQGLKFKPTWKSLPTYLILGEILIRQQKQKAAYARKIKSCFVALPFELASWVNLLTFVHSYGEQWSQGILWPPCIRYAFDILNPIFSI